MLILNVIIEIFIALCVLLIPVGIVLGIIFAVKAVGEKDSAHKVRNFWIMGMSFVLPFVLMFVLLSVWGLVGILTNTYK